MDVLIPTAKNKGTQKDKEEGERKGGEGKKEKEKKFSSISCYESDSKSSSLTTRSHHLREFT